MENPKINDFDYFLFDLDNSLLNIPKPSEYFDNILLRTIEYFKREDPPKRNERDKFWRLDNHYIELLKVWGIYLENYGEFWKIFDNIDFKLRKFLINNNEIKLYSDVIDIFEKLSSFQKKLGIVSNTAMYIVDYTIEFFGIKKYIHYAFGLGYEKEQKIAKPSPEGIKYTLNKLNYNPNQSKAIMIGDSKVDIYAAKKANIYACLVKRGLNKYNQGYNDWKHKPDYIIDDLNDFSYE
ncbi:MAG: HAD family hydrolase [Candidatus Lokiarchaeota archaeon]|nr:HAD family hydrolase [Candidatus Lokiarchaeota archaeon]